MHCGVTAQNNFIVRGKNFRADFDRIGGLRALTSVPFMALTASAPSNVQSTIVESLQLDNPVYVSGNLDRPNIYMSATPITSLIVSTCIQVLAKPRFYEYWFMIIERFKWLD